MRHNSFTRYRGAGQHVFTPIDATYKLIFDEEFNGSSVDSTTWIVHNSGTFANAPALAANVSVGGSVCALQCAGTMLSFTGAFMHTSGSTNNFLVSGANGSFYIEGRVRMPAANSDGFWPSFWGNNAGSFPEIDWAEWRGGFPTVMPETYFNANGAEDYHTEPDLGLGHLGAAYHIYGVWFQPGVSIKYYVDGTLYGTCTNGVSGVLMDNGPYAINLEIGANGYGTNPLDGSTTFPGVMKVDYVHVYQVGGTPITPQTNYGGPGSTAGPTT